LFTDISYLETDVGVLKVPVQVKVCGVEETVAPLEGEDNDGVGELASVQA